MWLKEFQIAIVEKNIEQIEELMQDIPTLSKANEIDAAICLIDEAKSMVTQLRDEAQTSMIQMKKNIDFLKVTQEKAVPLLDVTL